MPSVDAGRLAVTVPFQRLVWGYDSCFACERSRATVRIIIITRNFAIANESRVSGSGKTEGPLQEIVFNKVCNR